MPLYTITRKHVIDFVVWYKDQPTDQTKKARATAVRNAYTLLSSVLQSAVENEHIEKNVAYRIPLPKDDAEEEMDYLLRTGLVNGEIFTR